MKNKPLLRIESKDFILIFSGKAPLRNSFAGKRIGKTECKSAQHAVLYEAIDTTNNVSFCAITRKDRSYFAELNIEYESLDEGGFPLPIFFEQVDYNVFFESKEESSIKLELEHEDSNLLSRIGKIRKEVSVGTINFQNNVGFTRFLVKSGVKKLLELSFFVYPVKLDFFKQRRVMLADINQLHDSMLFEILRPTKDKAISKKRKGKGLEWLTLFNQYIEFLVELVVRIELKSHSTLYMSGQHRLISKIKGSDKTLLRHANKYGLDNLINVQTKLYSEKKILTNDTPENRYIKFLLRQVVKNGRIWRGYLEKISESRTTDIKDSPYYLKFSKNIKSLEKRLKNPFWESVNDANKALVNKGNFGFHQEFVKTEGLVRKLKRGLAFEWEGSERANALGMDKLYEIWVYIKMSQIISTLLDKEDSPLKLKYSSDKFTSFLETGIESKVKIADDIFLYTNRLFTTETKPYRVPIVSQKPDIILEIASSRSLIILDAKYRLGVYAIRSGQRLEKLSYGNLITEDFLPNEILYFANDEDINVIHRYRDAICLNNPEDFKHVVIKGIIIFPGILSPESLEEAKLAYDRFNISCLPLTPGEPDITWKTERGYDFNDFPKSDTTTERIRSVAEVLKSLILKN